MAVPASVIAAAPYPPGALALRLERAEAEQLARTGAPFLAGVLDVGGGLVVSKGPGSRSSSTFGLGLAGAVSAADLDRVEAHLGTSGGEVRIELCAHAHPSLATELARRGYRRERVLLVLCRTLSPAERRARPRVPGDVDVREIVQGEEQAFANAFALAHLDRTLAPEDADELLAIPRAEGSACFATRDSEAIVGVAVVSEHGRVAVLSGAGVLPAWRGHALQLALVRARLAWAARRGCEIATSAVAPGGASQRTLEHAGFRAAYSKAVMVRGA